MAEAKAITTHIVEYLEEHAEAGGSLESIAIWWMTRQQASEPKGAIRAALEQLRSAGVIADHITPDGKTVYFLNGESDARPRDS
ncbi:MAG: hypothetical protein ABW208_06630 [Pyrinomonadaceae bacterium]